VRGEAHLERAVALVRADAVENDDAFGPADGDEAREGVDELAPIVEVGRPEEVVAVEEVEGRISDRAVSASPRRRAAPRRR
jgi:hypothetical protein